MSYFPSTRDAGFALTTSDSGLVNSRVLAASGITLVDDGINLTIVNYASTPGAPNTASYIVVANDASLTNERALVVSSPLAFVDGGAGSNYTVSLGIVPISLGGTGASSLTDAFDNLSPLTTKGDLLTHTGTDNVRQAAGANNQLLTYDSSLTNGVKSTWGGMIGVATQTANFTMVIADPSIQLVSASGGAVAATLPLASAGTNKIWVIKKTDSTTNNVTVTRAGSDTIDGATTFVLRKRYDAVTLVSDGTNWHVI